MPSASSRSRTWARKPVNWLKTRARCPSAAISTQLLDERVDLRRPSTPAYFASTSEASRLSCRSRVSDRKIVNRFLSQVVDQAEHLLALPLQVGLVDLAVPRVSATSSTCSCLGGRSAATCSLVRRSMSGRIRRRSGRQQPRGRRRRSTGAAVDSVNRCGLGNSPGATIESSDHRSIRLFSSGVPVIASLNGAAQPPRALVGLGLVVLHELRLVEHQPAPGQRRRSRRSRAGTACRR